MCSKLGRSDTFRELAKWVCSNCFHSKGYEFKLLNKSHRLSRFSHDSKARGYAKCLDCGKEVFYDTETGGTKRILCGGWDGGKLRGKTYSIHGGKIWGSAVAEGCKAGG